MGKIIIRPSLAYCRELLQLWIFTSERDRAIAELTFFEECLDKAGERVVIIREDNFHQILKFGFHL